MRRARAAALAGLVVMTTGGCGGAGGNRPPPPARTTKTAVPLPSGWKTVTHEHFAVDVPVDWQVTKWQPTCGVASPTVYLGPQGMRLSRCTTRAYGAEVDLGAFGYQGTEPPVVTQLNGLKVYETVVHTSIPWPPQGTVTDIWMRVVSRVGTLGIFVSAGESAAFPGGGPGMAAKIVHTVHVSATGSE